MRSVSYETFRQTVYCNRNFNAIALGVIAISFLLFPFLNKIDAIFIMLSYPEM